MQSLEQSSLLVLLPIMVTLSVLALASLAAINLISLLISWWLREKSTQQGPFCGHCGRPLRDEPKSAVALEDLSLYRYECRHCRQPTLLPIADAE